MSNDLQADLHSLISFNDLQILLSSPFSNSVFFQKSEDGSDTVTCSCCNWRCIIPKDDHGKCNVRYNKDGKLYLSVYGYPCALHVDPVEKKPLHHFLPGTKIFSVGTIGCNFKCTFCQNWDISQAAAMFDEEIKEKSGDIEDLVVDIQKSGYEAVFGNPFHD